jgi:MinD-like ATPase involved in chromosome partitioning or flagellar assembly
MTRIVAIHSYRGGTGKSNLTANVAWLAARAGRRVAVLDADVHSPGVHVVLGLPRERVVFTLTDHVFGRCSLEEAAYDMGSALDVAPPGTLHLVPSSMRLEAIAKVAAEGYDVSALHDRLRELGQALALDLLLVDTHPGLNRETMLTTAVAQTLAIVVRPDQQDVHGTAVLVEAASRLAVPRVLLVANKVPASLDAASVRRRFEEAFRLPVVATLPVEEDMMSLGSQGVFARVHPTHPFTDRLRALTEAILAEDAPA